MRFLDANVLIYAYFSRPKYAKQELELKKSAKEIIAGIDKGEKAVISVVHLSEAANILCRGVEPSKLAAFLKTLSMNENITILPVSRENFISAVEESEGSGIGVNDCLAHVLMKVNDVDEIYSFDRDFDKFDDIKRVER